MAFQLRVKLSGHEIAAAAFHALVASAWSIYTTQQFAWLAAHPDVQAPIEFHERWAKAAFEEVIADLPDGHSFVAELERYVVDEAIPRLRLRVTG